MCSGTHLLYIYLTANKAIVTLLDPFELFRLCRDLLQPAESSLKIFTHVGLEHAAAVLVDQQSKSLRHRGERGCGVFYGVPSPRTKICRFRYRGCISASISQRIRHQRPRNDLERLERSRDSSIPDEGEEGGEGNPFSVVSNRCPREALPGRRGGR